MGAPLGVLMLLLMAWASASSTFRLATMSFNLFYGGQALNMTTRGWCVPSRWKQGRSAAPPHADDPRDQGAAGATCSRLRQVAGLLGARVATLLKGFVSHYRCRRGRGWAGGGSVGVSRRLCCPTAPSLPLQETVGDTAVIAKAVGFAYHSSRVHVISRYPLLDPPDNTRAVLVVVQPGRFVLFSVGHALADPYSPYLIRDGASLSEGWWRFRLERCNSLSAPPVLALETAFRTPPITQLCNSLLALSATLNSAPIILVRGRALVSCLTTNDCRWVTSTRRRSWTGRRAPRATAVCASPSTGPSVSASCF